MRGDHQDRRTRRFVGLVHRGALDSWLEYLASLESETLLSIHAALPGDAASTRATERARRRTEIAVEQIGEAVHAWLVREDARAIVEHAAARDRIMTGRPRQAIGAVAELAEWAALALCFRGILTRDDFRVLYAPLARPRGQRVRLLR